ncbi:MAG: ATP-binding protein [Gammaproteobacteria bacterium]|nr:ATP-binding protein [Gammaproteobacteria bacterium]
MNKKLSDLVRVSPQFQRSIKIDVDIEKTSSLEGYICQNTALNVLETTAKHLKLSNQRAFTWTGPYGGGKSSLALLLCSLVSSNERLKVKAKKILGVSKTHIINQVFSAEKDNWIILPVVGKRDNVVLSIANTINTITPGSRKKISTGEEIITSLTKLAETKKKGGVLLVIDELGKFLEAASKTGEDIYFYQELAEAANRCNGNLIVVGILHQAFEQYAIRLGNEVRNEWAKVQGRYVDIPIISATDEVIELISQAVVLSDEYDHKKTVTWSENVAKTIEKRRPGTHQTLASTLYNSWPLHPITTILIGQISKRRFSQSERSTFSFLSSIEPMSFKEFLRGQDLKPSNMYIPAMYWDYLRANHELSIIASPDGHRWSVAVDAVERAESKGLTLHVHLAKTIALIDLFSNGSGLYAETSILKISELLVSGIKIEKALKELAEWSIIVYRKHLSAWAIFAGSDFDLNNAILNTKEDINSLDSNALLELSSLNPIVAKRHYQNTGSIRWFNRTIAMNDDIKNRIKTLKSDQGCCGYFVLFLENNNISARSHVTLAKKFSKSSSEFPAIIGIPNNSEIIKELGIELSSLNKIVNNTTTIEGDSVARKEIASRTALVKSELEEEIRSAFDSARWFVQGEEIKNNKSTGLTRLASELADDIYKSSPYIYSELLNREVISSNVSKARRELMYRMINHQDEENLSFKNYPVEAGLYYTALKSTGIHHCYNEVWRFSAPTTSSSMIAGSVIPAWEALDNIIKSRKNGNIDLAEIYELLNRPPYGIKKGFLPIFVFSYFLANRQCLAMYVENMFIPEINEVQIDEWLQEPKRIAFRYIEIEKQRKKLLKNLSDALTKHLKRKISPDPLDSARALVALVYDLPNWTKKTDALSVRTKKIRQMLLKASDPHKVIFNDLPSIFHVQGKDLAEQVAQSINELISAYPKMLDEVASKILKALDHHGDLSILRKRAEKISGISGEFRLDAFIGRLSMYSGSNEDIEGLLSLSVTKSSSEWIDRDIDSALIQLSEWSLNYRKIEALASLENGVNSRRSMAVIFGSGGGYEVSDILDVEVNDERVNNIVGDLLSKHESSGTDVNIFLAAIAEVGARLLKSN